LSKGFDNIASPTILQEQYVYYKLIRVFCSEEIPFMHDNVNKKNGFLNFHKNYQNLEWK